MMKVILHCHGCLPEGNWCLVGFYLDAIGVDGSVACFRFMAVIGNGNVGMYCEGESPLGTAEED